jgi:hypothetical protein
VDADWWEERHGSKKRRRKTVPDDSSSETLDLFAPPMVRTPDTEASEAAADKLKKSVSGLRHVVYEIIKRVGPITALEVEEFDGFEKLAPTTVRKRCSELVALGWLAMGETVQVVVGEGRTTTAHLLTARTVKEREAWLDAQQG